MSAVRVLESGAPPPEHTTSGGCRGMLRELGETARSHPRLPVPERAATTLAGNEHSASSLPKLESGDRS